MPPKWFLAEIQCAVATFVSTRFHMPMVASASTVSPTIIAITTKATISPYSIAVAPRVVRSARRSVRPMVAVMAATGFMAPV